MNKENIKKLIFQVISDSGDDSTRDGLKGTPERVSKLYEELLSGYGKDINELVKNSLFKTTLDDMIVVKNIEFSSTCEHEMTPFFGMVNLGYIPNGNIIGLSKIPKIIEIFSKRLQTQERLTMQIAKTLMNALDAKGVAVTIDAAHQCMTMRGIKKERATTVTNYYLGAFKEDLSYQNRYLRYIAK